MWAKFAATGQEATQARRNRPLKRASRSQHYLRVPLQRSCASPCDAGTGEGHYRAAERAPKEIDPFLDRVRGYAKFFRTYESVGVPGATIRQHVKAAATARLTAPRSILHAAAKVGDFLDFLDRRNGKTRGVPPTARSRARPYSITSEC